MSIFKDPFRTVGGPRHLSVGLCTFFTGKGRCNLLVKCSPPTQLVVTAQLAIFAVISLRRSPRDPTVLLFGSTVVFLCHFFVKKCVLPVVICIWPQCLFFLLETPFRDVYWNFLSRVWKTKLPPGPQFWDTFVILPFSAF